MSTTDYKAPIRGVAKLILKLLTQLASLFINMIKDAELRMMASGLLDGATKTVDALSDADPNDSDQLREILNELVKTGSFRQGAQAELLGHIQKLDNENVRKSLTIINGHAFPIADILTDENSENTEQLKAYMGDILSSEDGMELFNALLSIILPPTYANTLTVLIIQALLDYLEANDSKANASIAIARLVTLQQRYEKKVA